MNVVFTDIPVAVAILLEQNVHDDQLSDLGRDRAKLEGTFVGAAAQYHICQICGRGSGLWPPETGSRRLVYGASAGQVLALSGSGWGRVGPWQLLLTFTLLRRSPSLSGMGQPDESDRLFVR